MEELAQKKSAIKEKDSSPVPEDTRFIGKNYTKEGSPEGEWWQSALKWGV